jgi:flagellar biosynthesis protein FliQ
MKKFLYILILLTITLNLWYGAGYLLIELNHFYESMVVGVVAAIFTAVTINEI